MTPWPDDEAVEDFRRHARSFIRNNLREVGPISLARRPLSDEEETAAVARDRVIQGLLWEGGLAGVCVPTEYGGRGLTPAHQEALNQELAGFEFPRRIQIPTFSPCAAVLLDYGTEEQKRDHLPAILKGEEIWLQLLSEPSGGSDAAGALTTAERDGEEWVLNGSKIWTTGAWWSDWGLCLARTNWDVPKHRGLTVFILPIRHDGVEMHRIEMLNGNKEFCQEFLTDVRIPDAWRVGDVDDGWSVCTRWMFHERMLFNSPLVTLPVGTTRGNAGLVSAYHLARDAGRLEDPTALDLVGESYMLELANRELQRRLLEGTALGVLPDQIAAVGRLFSASVAMRTTTIAFDLAGASGGAWSEQNLLADTGTDFLMRQAPCIGGGTTEMARNVVSERVLGMPREAAPGRETAFRDIPRGPSN
jgi:alkylation response protein AidB-like acyl-CoA dehydrogenase